MRHLSYLALLAGCLLGTAPLELVLRTRVYARWRRVLLAVLPGLVLGMAWDEYAISRRQWFFDWRYLTGVRFGDVPLEEVLFFLVVPACAVLTLEAVRRRRPGWLIGDEPGRVSSNEPGPLRGHEQRPVRGDEPSPVRGDEPDGRSR